MINPVLPWCAAAGGYGEKAARWAGQSAAVLVFYINLLYNYKNRKKQ